MNNLNSYHFFFSKIKIKTWNNNQIFINISDIFENLIYVFKKSIVTQLIEQMKIHYHDLKLRNDLSLSNSLNNYKKCIS